MIALVAIGCIAFAAIGFLAGLAAGIGVVKRALVCTCGDVDCGGSCIDWSNAS